MSEIPITGFKAYINSPELDNLFLFYGPEKYLHDQFVAQLEKKVFTDPASKDFNHHVLYGGDCSLAKIISVCSGYPMLSDRKLVVVKQFDEISLDEKESFLRYISNPQKSSVLVLTADTWGNTKFHKEILTTSKSVNCRKLYDKEIHSWVKSKFDEYKIDYDENSISFFIDNLGNSLLRLNTEIDKINNYLPEGKKLTTKRLKIA